MLVGQTHAARPEGLPMRIVNCQDTAFYRPRHPPACAGHADKFERVYPDRFQARYGFWRPVIRTAVMDYLKCGDPREGFARVRCPACRHEFFVAFSCKLRCICPSCHQKRTLVTSINIAENICARVAHNQFAVPCGHSRRSASLQTGSLALLGCVYYAEAVPALLPLQPGASSHTRARLYFRSWLKKQFLISFSFLRRIARPAGVRG